MRFSLKDIFIALLFILHLHVPIQIYNVHTTLNKINEKQIDLQSKKFEAVNLKISELLKNADILQACVTLAADFDNNAIYAYRLVGDDQSCSKNSELFSAVASKITNDINFKIENENSPTFILKRSLFPQAELITVTRVPMKSTFLEELKNNSLFRDALFRDFIGVILILCTYVYFALIQFLFKMKNKFRNQSEIPFWLKILTTFYGWAQLDAFKSIEDATQSLLEENKKTKLHVGILESAMHSSLVKELKQNKYQLPYSFMGAVVVVDINGYSDVVVKDSELSKKLKNQFAKTNAELLQRYGSIFESARGDDVVAIFRDERVFGDVSDSEYSLMALSMTRDLMHEFSTLKFESNVEGVQKYFKLKSGIAFSNITAQNAEKGLDFLADALTYSARLSSAITDKSKNSIALLADDVQKFQKFIQLPSSAQTVYLKGPGEKSIYIVDQFTSVEHIYVNNPELLKYFKSDTHILYLLNKILTEQSTDKIKNIISALMQIQVCDAKNDIITAWITVVSFVTTALTTATPATAKHNEQLLTQILTLGKNLIPNQMWNLSCTNTVSNAFNKNHPRIGAQIVELLSEKDVATLAIMKLEDFIVDNDPSFRTRGNILIFKATHMLNENVLADIFEMLDSDNTLRFSTGVYTACEVFNYYQLQGLQKLQTFDGYLKIKNKLSDIYKNKNSHSSNNKNNLSERLQNSLVQIFEA